MDLDGGGWDSVDQIDAVIGDAPLDMDTTYTGIETSINARFYCGSVCQTSSRDEI